MKRRSLTVVVLVILAVIFAVIVVDFLNHRPDRRGKNPYALEVDQYKVVDPALVSHRETRNYSLEPLKASGIFCHDGRLFVSGDSSLAVLTTEGEAIGKYPILPHSTCIDVDDQFVYIGFKSFVAKYDHSGNLVQQWPDLGERTVITGLAHNEERVYAADAGNRRVVIFSKAGEWIGDFEGKAETEAGHGFIVPSANFDLAVNSYGELWVVNPGKHALENYSDDGQMRGYWENASFDIDGFLGCCNPARISVLEDGSFLTSEKGMVRIKIYDPSGRMVSVVAPPDLFKEEGKAPDVCAGAGSAVYALDFDRNVIRVFEPKENG
jgi:hypothetical protein